MFLLAFEFAYYVFRFYFSLPGWIINYAVFLLNTYFLCGVMCLHELTITSKVYFLINTTSYVDRFDKIIYPYGCCGHFFAEYCTLNVILTIIINFI